MRASETSERRMSRAQVLFCMAVGILLFSQVSIPVNASIHSPVGGILSSIPGIAIVEDVDNFALTQTRFSDLSVMLPAAFFILTAIAVRNSHRVARLRIGGMVGGFLVFAIVAGVSACVFREFVEALKLAIYVLIVATFFSFQDGERRRLLKSLVSMCLVAGVLNAIVTLWQYGVMSGWVFNIMAIRLYRPDGLFGDSIISALFADVTIAVVVLHQDKPSGLLRVAVLALCTAAGIVTGARTFYYLLGILGLLLLLAKTRDVSLGWKVVLVVSAVAAVALLFSPTGQSMMNLLTGEQSVSSRELKQRLAMELFLGSPVLGIGTGQYAATEAALWVWGGNRLGLHGTNPHNVYLQTLCENGLVGFVPLIASTVALVLRVLQRKKTLALVLLLLYLAVAWTLGIQYSVSFTAFFVALFCALLCAKASE